MARLGRLNALHAALSGIAGGIGGYERLREKEKAEAERQRLEAERAEERSLRNLQTQEWLRDRNYTEIEPRAQAMQRIAPTLADASRLADAEARPALRSALQAAGSAPITRGGVSGVSAATEQALAQKRELDKPYRDTVEFGGKQFGRRQLPQERDIEMRQREREQERTESRKAALQAEREQIDALVSTGRYTPQEATAAVRGGSAYKAAPEPEWKAQGYESEKGYLDAVRKKRLAEYIAPPRDVEDPMKNLIDEVARYRRTPQGLTNTLPSEEQVTQFINGLLSDRALLMGGGAVPRQAAPPPRVASPQQRAQQSAAQETQRSATSLGGGSANPFGGGQSSSLEQRLREAGYSEQEIRQYMAGR